MKNITPILVLILILGILSTSGCIQESQTKTYLKNGFNITLPADMKENTSFSFVTSPTEDSKYAIFGNDKLSIAIIYDSIDEDIKKAFTLDQFKKLTWNTLKNNQDNKSTQLAILDKSKDGITIYEEIFTTKDPISNNELKNKRVVFIKNYDSLRQIIFQTKASDFESMQETINNIQNSIVLT